MPSAKTAKQSEQSTKQAIVLQSGLSIEDLSREMEPFIASVTQQLESEDPAMRETAEIFGREYVGALIGQTLVTTEKQQDPLTVRDRIAELYFAYLNLAGRIRLAVQQAETMARRQERFAEIVRSNIEAWMLTSWDAKKITGHYREFRISKNPDKVMVVDETQIPAEFFDVPPVQMQVLNKTRLAEALKENKAIVDEAAKNPKLSTANVARIIDELEIPGAILETNRTRLDIK